MGQKKIQSCSLPPEYKFWKRYLYFHERVRTWAKKQGNWIGNEPL